MAEDDVLSDEARAALRRRGNPYAFAEGQVAETQNAGGGMAEAVRRTYRLSEDPYALHFYTTEEQGAVPPLPHAAAAPRRHLSKAEFRSRCRDVFRPYIPALEKGRLRPHHNAFITRNEARSPDVRYALAERLGRYGLADIPGLQSQFNREEEAFTEAKLIAIERAVLGSDL